MTQAKTRQAAQAPTEPPADPLADLREGDDLANPETAPPADDDTPTPPGTMALVTPETQAHSRATIMAAWHADTVALGFLHKGGTCGCHYLAGVAVTAALPLTPETPED